MLLGSETALLRMSHVLLGEGGRERFELRMEAQSCRSRDAGSRLGHGERGSNQYPPPPSQKFFSSSSFDIRSRETSVSALFFMNVSSPSAPAVLPSQRPEQTNVYVMCAFKQPSG